jgi:biotin synthase-like enzyme
MTQSRLQQPAARAVLTVLTVAVMILIFVFSTETAEESDKTSGFFSDAVIRILHPAVLLPTTTALGTIDPEGREKGILSGANVVMPNLTPASVRKNYMLYDNKLNTGAESAAHVADLAARMRAIGYEITADRGDYRQKRAGCPV